MYYWGFTVLGSWKCLYLLKQSTTLGFILCKISTQATILIVRLTNTHSSKDSKLPSQCGNSSRRPSSTELTCFFLWSTTACASRLFHHQRTGRQMNGHYHVAGGSDDSAQGLMPYLWNRALSIESKRNHFSCTTCPCNCGWWSRRLD